jgi:hypothetical protein
VAGRDSKRRVAQELREFSASGLARPPGTLVKLGAPYMGECFDYIRMLHERGRDRPVLAGKRVPQAYSGLNGFAQWGPPPNHYTSVIVVGQETAEVVHSFTGCRIRARINDRGGGSIPKSMARRFGSVQASARRGLGCGLDCATTTDKHLGQVGNDRARRAFLGMDPATVTDSEPLAACGLQAQLVAMGRDAAVEVPHGRLGLLVHSACLAGCVRPDSRPEDCSFA